MEYFPGDHLTHIDAVISYHPETDRFVCTGVDCEKEVNYMLTDDDKRFLREELPAFAKRDRTPVSFLQAGTDSEIIFAHISADVYHFFLVLHRRNYAAVQLQLQDISRYLTEGEKDVAGVASGTDKQTSILANFKVNKSASTGMCDTCKTQGICAPKYLNHLLSIAR